MGTWNVLWRSCIRVGGKGSKKTGNLPHVRQRKCVHTKSQHDHPMLLKKIKVLLVDDHTVVRQGLRALLGGHEDMEIVGEAENGREAVQLAAKLKPDVVLMDLAMPLSNGLQATRRVLEVMPETKILVLTSYHDDECVAQLMKAGASGYLVKQTAANELPQAIREVRRGNSFFSPAVAKMLTYAAKAAFRSGGQVKDNRELTTREEEVLKLIADGCSNKEAADKLGISIKTIEKHRQQVMNKLNIHEAAGLTRWAISRRLVPVGPSPTPATEESEPAEPKAA